MAVNILRQIWSHPANRQARWAGLIRLARWQFHKRVIGGEMPFPYHGYTMPGHQDSHSTSSAYYFSGLPDWWEMRFIYDYLRAGDAFLDVGANVGLYSLMASSLVGDTGHVDAFEPADVPARRLQQAVTANKIGHIVSVHRFAVSDQPGDVEFESSADDCQAHVRRPGESAHRCSAVPAIRLDEFCGATRYAMAKFDIEGHEPLALAGASDMLAAGNPTVMQIETAGYSKLFGVPTAELIQRLADSEYDCFRYIPQQRKLLPAPRPWEMRLDNVLAIYRPLRESVEARLVSTEHPE